MRLIRSLLVSTIIIICWTSTAAAQPDEKAFEHFDRGAQLYFDGEYYEAIEAFEKGYTHQQHPMFQVNIALAYWRLGKLSRAIDHAEIAASSNEDLPKDVATENVARMATWTVASRSRSVADTITDVRREQIARSQEQARQPDVRERGAGRSPLSALGWAGTAVAATGVGLLVGWSLVEIGLSDDVAALEDAGRRGDADRFDEIEAEVQQTQQLARILLFGGVGLAAVGSGLLLTDLLTPRDTGEVTIGLTTRGSLLVGWSGRF